MTTKATRTVKLDEDVAETVKVEAKRRRLNVQDFLEDCVRTGLKVRGIDVPEGE